MPTNTTRNMPLRKPAVSGTLGPLYASEINADLDVIASHDHTSGKGLPIRSAALNIDADVDFHGHGGKRISYVGLYGSNATPPVLLALYSDGTDLYFRDGNSNFVRITTGGFVTQPVNGGWANLVAPAVASYAVGSGTFKLISAPNTAAPLSIGPLIIVDRTVTDGTAKAATLQVPAGLAAGYTLTLPPAVPVGPCFMVLANTGANAGSIINGPLLVQGIVSGNIAPGGVGGVNIADNTITQRNVAPPTVTPVSLLNGWNNVTTVSYYKDVSGVVHIRGAATMGSNAQIFQLPAGVRPATDARFNCSADFSGTVSGCHVNADVSGFVSVLVLNPPATVWFDCISFLAA